jgi:steroid delta-isomerase-like uncharacterized protein
MIEDVWARGRIAAIEELVATDYIRHGPVAEQPLGFISGRKVPLPAREFQGIPDLIAMVKWSQATFDDQQITVDDQIAEGHKVATRWTAVGTHVGTFMGVPGSGRRFRHNGVSICRIEDGKIAEEWILWDFAAMMSQLT